jgi:hypothetical protein
VRIIASLSFPIELEYIPQDIDPEDMNALDRLLPSAPAQQRTLADMIFEKIDSAVTQTAPGERPAYKGSLIISKVAHCYLIL